MSFIINAESIQEEFDSLVTCKDFISKGITGKVLLETPDEENKCLLHPILPKVGVACLAGTSDTGKSSLLRQLAISVSSGTDSFLGAKLNSTHNKIIYVSTEDLANETRILLRKQLAANPNGNVEGINFLFNTEDLLNVLNIELENSPTDVVIIDCFADQYIGDLKDTSQIRSSLNKYYNLAQKHNCLFIILHHTGKRTENNRPNKNNLLGAQGFEAKTRLVIELRPDQNDSNIRHLCIVKGNYLPGNYKTESFVLKFDEESLTFSNTNDRVPFELLAINAGDDSKRKEALRLKSEGKTLDEIAKVLGYKTRGGVSKLLKVN